MNGALTPKRTSYWLLVKDKCNDTDIFTNGLLDGQRALAVFSFVEEAEMFLCLRGSADGWRVRETTAGELLSLFYTKLRGITHVTLDPIPENSFLNASGLLSTTREYFMERLESVSAGGDDIRGQKLRPRSLRATGTAG